VVRWHANIPQDPDGLPSYVEDVNFDGIPSWSDPTLFGRVLKCFSRMKTLSMYQTNIPSPEDLRDVVLGRELTYLVLARPFCTLSTLMSFILSLPALEELFLDTSTIGGPPPTTPPDSDKRNPLRALWLSGVGSEIAASISQCGITSRKIDLAAGDKMIEKILVGSSQIVTELLLQGTWLLWDSAD